jgi:hypothetical protein
MKYNVRHFILAIVPRPLISPCGFSRAAVLLCLFYMLCDGLGWREYTAFLSGSVPAGQQAVSGLLFGILYAASYFGFVLVVPILILASVIFAFLPRGGRCSPLSCDGGKGNPGS